MDMPETHLIELAPDELKRPCCGMLKIQPHTPDCTGEIRSSRRVARRAAPMAPIAIVDRFSIAAAHSAALIEKQYRECRVYGMGTRKTA